MKVETLQWLPSPPIPEHSEHILEQPEPFPVTSSLLQENTSPEPLFFDDAVHNPEELLSFPPNGLTPADDHSPGSTGNSSNSQSEDVDHVVIRQPDLEWISQTPPISDSSFQVDPPRADSFDLDPGRDDGGYTTWSAMNLWQEYRHFTKPAELGSLLKLCETTSRPSFPAEPY